MLACTLGKVKVITLGCTAVTARLRGPQMVARTILVNASYAPSLIAFRGALLERMVGEGNRVYAAAPDILGPIAEKLTAIGVTPVSVALSRTGLNPVADVAYYRSVRRIIRRYGIDLILSYTIKPCIWGSLAAHAEGVESVSLVTGLGYAFIPGGGLKQRIVRAISITLWRRATAANRTVIFQNPDDRDDFIRAGALSDGGKARLVNGSGVDMQEFGRAELPSDPRFLMIARLLGNKGVREYAAAAREMKAEGSPARFTLAGYFDDGPDAIGRDEVERWTAAGLDFIGPQDDVRPALANCSVYVLPSYREGTPRTVLEAMATGRPVITTDVPGCRQTIEHEVSGLLVAPQDTRSLADAMRRMARDTEGRRQMGEAAFQRCRERYAVKAVNKAMFTHVGLSGSP